MTSKLALATYGLVRGDTVNTKRPDPNTSAAAAAHQNNAASKSRARAAQLLQADMAPPMMTVQDMSLDRHLENRYVPHQVPFAALSCGQYLTVQDVQRLARVFEMYNVLPNNQQAEVVNNPEVMNLACASTTATAARDRNPRETPPPQADVRQRGSTAKPGTAPRRRSSQSALGPRSGRLATAAASATTTTNAADTALKSASSPPTPPPPPQSPQGWSAQGAPKSAYTSRRGAARVLETKLTRDEDDTALSVEWVVELLLDIIAVRMEEASESDEAQLLVRTEADPGTADGAGYDSRRTSLSHSPPLLSRRTSRTRPSPATATAATSSAQAHRAAKLRGYREELMAWIAPLAQTCDARRHATVFEGCRRQQQMLIQYHRGMLEAELLQVKKQINTMPTETAGGGVPPGGVAPLGASRTGRGFRGAHGQVGGGVTTASAQLTTHEVADLPATDTTSRRSPATINFLGSFAAPGPEDAGALCSPDEDDLDDSETDVDVDRPAYGGGGTGTLTATGKRAAANGGDRNEVHSLDTSMVASPTSSYRGRGGGDGGVPSRSTVAMSVLDALLPPPTTMSSTTISAAVPHQPPPVGAAEDAFFLPACYFPSSGAAACAPRGASTETAANGGLVTSAARRAGGDIGEEGGESCSTRPPSATPGGRGGPAVFASATTTAHLFPTPRQRGRPLSATELFQSTTTTRTAPPVSVPATACGEPWLTVLTDLPSWSAAMRRYLEQGRLALGTQTLEDVVLALANTHATSTNKQNNPATTTTNNNNNNTNGASSPLRTSSFRRPPGHNRLSRLPRLQRDGPCRVVCWTDLSNNFILDDNATDNQGGFLEQTYVRGPSMMLEGDGTNHHPPEAGLNGAAGGGSDEEEDGDDDTDENTEEALLSAIHGGARRRHIAGRRSGAGGAGGVSMTTADDLAQQTAIVTDVETFAAELKGLHRQSADHVVMTASGSLIVTASKDGVVKTWDGSFGQFKSNLLNIGTAWVLSMTLLREDQILLVATSNAELTLVELATGNVVHKYRGCTSLLTALRAVVQPDAQHIAKYGMKAGECGPHRVSFEAGTSAEGYHALREREVQLTRQALTVPVQPIEGFTSPTAFYFCTETSLGLFGTSEGAVGCVDLSGELCRSASLVAKGMQPLSLLFSARAHAPGTTVTGVCFSASTGCVLSTGHDGTVTRVPLSRDGHTGRYLVGTPTAITTYQLKPIRFLVFNPQARLVATSHSDRRVQLWTLTRTSVELVHQFPQETHDIVSIVFMPKEDRIAMLLTDHSLRVFDVRGYRPSAIITTRTNADQQLQDMASVTLKLSATDADGCVGYHAHTRRLVCGLRSPILYVPASGPRVEGSKRDKAAAEQAKQQQVPSARRRSVVSVNKATAGSRSSIVKDASGEDSLSDSSIDELAALKTLQRLSLSSQGTSGGENGETPAMTSALLTRRESAEVIELVERRQRERIAARAEKRQRQEAEALLARRLAPHTTHLRGSVIEVVPVPDRLEVHTFTSDRWKVWSLATGALLREMEVTREVRLAFPRFRRATFVCGAWSTAACTRLLLGGFDGVLTTLDPETGLVTMTEQLNATTASAGALHVSGKRRADASTKATITGGVDGGVLSSASPTSTTPTLPPLSAQPPPQPQPHTTGSSGTPMKGKDGAGGSDEQRDITVIAYEKERAFICAGRHCFVRRYQPNVLDAHGAEEYTSMTLSLPPTMTTSITACCVVRDSHMCVGTMDGRILFYRLVDQSAPYAEEILRESYPSGEPDVGGVLGVFFLNEKNQGLVVVVMDTGVLHVYAYLKGLFVGRLRLCRAHECHLTAVSFHRFHSLLVIGDSLGRVRVLDISAFVSDSTVFKRVIRSCGAWQGATSDITALSLVHNTGMTATAVPASSVEQSTTTMAAAASAAVPGQVGARGSSGSPLASAGWLLVGSSDGNVRLFWLPHMASAAMRMGSAANTRQSLATTAAAAASSVTGANRMSVQESPFPRASCAPSGPSHGFSDSIVNYSFAGAGDLHAIAAAAAASAAAGSVTGTCAPVSSSGLVGLLGCDGWQLGEDSTYSLGVALPVEEVSARHTASQAVLEDVLKRSKAAVVVSSSVTGGAAVAPAAPITTTTTTMTTSPPTASVAMNVGAAPSPQANTGKTVKTKHATTTANTTRGASQKATTAQTAALQTPQALPPAPAARTVTSLLPSTQSLRPGETTTMINGHDDKNDDDVDALPQSVALGSVHAQRAKVTLDASPQRHISPPELSLAPPGHRADAPPPQLNRDSSVEAGSRVTSAEPRRRRPTTASAIASVLCGDRHSDDDDYESSDGDENGLHRPVSHSRHATLLLAAAAAAAGPAGLSSAADTTYAAAHRHMSSTVPNPLLHTYPVPLLRKLGVVLPNQVVPDGGEDAALPAELAFDPVRLRAYLRAGRRSARGSSAKKRGSTATKENPARQKMRVEDGNTHRRERRLTAVMNPSEAHSDEAATGSSVFLTDLPRTGSGEPRRVAQKVPSSSTRSSSILVDLMEAVEADTALAPHGQHTSSRAAAGRGSGGGGGGLADNLSDATHSTSNSIVTTRTNSFGGTGLAQTRSPLVLTDLLATTRAACANTSLRLSDSDVTPGSVLPSLHEQQPPPPQHLRRSPPPPALNVTPPPPRALSVALPPRAAAPPDTTTTSSSHHNTLDTATTTTTTTPARGLASLQWPSKVQPCVVRAASAASLRSGSRRRGSSLPGSPNAKTLKVPSTGPVGAGPGSLIEGDSTTMHSPLTLTLADRSRTGGALPHNSVSIARTFSTTTAVAATLADRKRLEDETIAFPDGLPPVEVLEERRDQLMLAHLAQQLDSLKPTGCAEGTFTQAIERTWRRRRGDAAARAAATGVVLSTAALGMGGGAAHGSDMVDPGSTMGLNGSSVLGGSRRLGQGVSSPASARLHTASSGAAATASATTTTAAAGRRPTHLTANATPSRAPAERQGGGFSGLNLGLLALPTESAAAAAVANSAATGAGSDDPRTRGTTSASAPAKEPSTLPAHERLQQYMETQRKTELQALRDRLAAREEQETHRRRRPGGAAVKTSAASTASTANSNPNNTRPLPRGRDELPLFSGQQRLHGIHVTLPSTLARDEAAKLQLRQLQAMSGTGSHAPAELSASAPAPHVRRAY